MVFSILSVFLIFTPWSGATAETPQLVGGQCDYKRYRGTAEIVLVARIGQGQESYQDEHEVKFVFHPQEAIKEPFAQVRGREFPLLMDSGTRPTGIFLEQHGIRVGVYLECDLKVIIRGSCTPVMFEFPWTGRTE